jgi:hypothetical protein
MFSGEDTSRKKGSVLMIAKSSYQGATPDTEAVGVVVGVENCSEPMVDEGILFDFDFVGELDLLPGADEHVDPVQYARNRTKICRVSLPWRGSAGSSHGCPSYAEHVHPPRPPG